MIDWLNTLYNTFWITGLALIVSAFSYNDWRAKQQGINLRQQLTSSSFQLPFSLGLALVSLGLLFLAQVWWERLIWLVFVGVFVYQSWLVKEDVLP
jgi:hypothetical protein